MTIPDGPESHLVYASDPRELPPAPAPTHFYVHYLGMACHLGTLGYLVETLRSRTGGVIWRAPIEAKPAARKFDATRRALEIGRERMQRSIDAKQVTSDERPA